MTLIKALNPTCIVGNIAPKLLSAFGAVLCIKDRPFFIFPQLSLNSLDKRLRFSHEAFPLPIIILTCLGDKPQ